MMQFRKFANISVGAVKDMNYVGLFSNLPKISILGQNSNVLATRHLYSLCVKSKEINGTSKSFFSCKSTRSVLFANCLKTVILHRGLRNVKVDPPVDYLPFPWERRKKTCYITTSGDVERDIGVDPTLPKPNFELSEELKTADDNIKKLFSLQTASKKERMEVKKRLLLEKVQQHPFDFDSPEVKIALRTLQVRGLMEHYKVKPYEKRGKVILLIHISRRNKNLRILRNMDSERYDWLVKELNIDYTLPDLGAPLVKYTRKNDLRRLTKEYCEKMKKEKLDAYHAKLKEQQEAFLKEKEETLAWIAREEAALGLTNNKKVKETKEEPSYVAYKLHFDNYVG